MSDSIRKLRLEYELQKMNQRALSSIVQAKNASTMPTSVNQVDSNYLMGFEGQNDFIQAENDDVPDHQRTIIQQKKYEAKRIFQNNLLKMCNPITAERILNDPRISEDETLKLNSIWTKFVSDLKAQYNSINAETFIDFANTYLYTVKSKKEGNNSIATSSGEISVIKQFEIEGNVYGIFKRPTNKNLALYDVNNKKIIDSKSYASSIPISSRRTIGRIVTEAIAYINTNGHAPNATPTHDLYGTYSPKDAMGNSFVLSNPMGIKTPSVSSSKASTPIDVNNRLLMQLKDLEGRSGKMDEDDMYTFHETLEIAGKNPNHSDIEKITTFKKAREYINKLLLPPPPPPKEKLKKQPQEFQSQIFESKKLKPVSDRKLRPKDDEVPLSPAVSDLLKRSMKSRRKAQKTDDDDDNAKEWEGKGISKSRTKQKQKLIIYGCGLVGDKGINNNNVPSIYQPFGNFLINTKILEENNMVRLLYAKTYLYVTRLTSKKVSDDLKAILNDIIDLKKFNTRLYGLLNDPEKEYCNRLLVASGVKSSLKIKIDTESDYEKNKKRWSVIQGIINSGNDSDELKSEAKQLLAYFLKAKTITKADYEQSVSILE